MCCHYWDMAQNANNTSIWTVGARRMGTVHIVRYWVTLRDGVEVDRYESRDLAQAYCDYFNGKRKA